MIKKKAPAAKRKSPVAKRKPPAAKRKAKAIDPALNRNQIAQIFGVSANTIDKWRIKGMPVESEGGNGQAYEFRYSECKKWYDDSKESERRDKAELDDFVAKQQAEFLGFKPTDQQSRLSAHQIKELASAQLVQMQAAAKRRTLVSVEEMVDLLDVIFAEIRSALDAQPDWLDRELSLTSEQVIRVVEYNDGILTQMSQSIVSACLFEVDSEDDDDQGQMSI